MNEMKQITPPRFEDEYPEEAETLMKLCQNKKLREAVQWSESSIPREDRLYPHLNDMKLSILGWKHMMFTPSKRTGGYERLSPKVGRNDPCSCGSGKKFKKCCINELTS